MADHAKADENELRAKVLKLEKTHEEGVTTTSEIITDMSRQYKS